MLALLAAAAAGLAPACVPEAGGANVGDDRPDASRMSGAARDAAPPPSDTRLVDAPPRPSDARPADAAPPPPAPVTASTTCTAVPLDAPLMVTAGREVLCALDLGDVNVRLVVTSWERSKPETLREERQCTNRLRLSTQTFDATTMARKPLPKTALDNLVLVIKQLQTVCEKDRGALVGASATQWARYATNEPEIVDAIKKDASLTIEIPTPEQEAQYGYVAATYKRAGFVALDARSDTVALSYQETGGAPVKAVSLASGYLAAATKHFPATGTDTYDAARASYRADVKAQFEEALKALSPPASLRAIRDAVKAGKLKTQIIVLAQDAGLKLAVTGALKYANGRWIDVIDIYNFRVAMEMPSTSPGFPGSVAGLIARPELTRYFSDVVKAPDFMTLRSEPVRSAYGVRMMVVPALLDWLMDELGLAEAVLVPQEIPIGYVLAKR